MIMIPLLPPQLKSRLLPLYQRVRQVTLLGDRVECPVCRRHYRRMLPLGDRLGAVCPGCGAYERHRLLWVGLQALVEQRQIAWGGKLLHVAPEPCLTPLFQADYDYLSIDRDRHKAMQTMDITQLALPSASMDAVVCNYVLDHVPDDRRALAELSRVLKPGGWASLMVYLQGETTDEDPSLTDPDQRRQRFGQPDHVRQYGHDYAHRLAAAGFELLRIPLARLGSPEQLQRWAIAWEPDLWLCRKASSATP